MVDMKISAEPSKRFFIDMLTKDIGLVECILDLVDNSIDSLIRRNELQVMDILTNATVPFVYCISIHFMNRKLKVGYSPRLH